MCLDLLDQFWAKVQYESQFQLSDDTKEDEKLEQEEEEEVKTSGNNMLLIINCCKQDIIDALHGLKLLNCRNDEERKFILDKIENSEEYLNESNIYYKFLKYLFDVESLFCDSDKINALLRDIGIAIHDYGIDKKVNRDELQFLCRDINDVLVIPFMNTIQRDGNKLYLWDIWNNLLCLNYLKESVAITLSLKHSAIRMSETELKQLVFDMHKTEIIIDKKQNAWRDRMERTYSENDSLIYTHKPKTFQATDLSDILKLRNSLRMNTESRLKKKSRIASFYKSKITKTELMQNIEGIFQKIKEIQKHKISVTVINQYYIEDVVETEKKK
eukprot:375837_1